MAFALGPGSHLLNGAGAFAKCGEYARVSLERALRLEEKSESRRLYGEIGYHLGEALWRLGERRRARELILQLRQTATRKEPYQEEHESAEALDAWLAAHPL